MCTCRPLSSACARSGSFDAVIDSTLSPDYRLGDALEVYVRREDAERFVEGVRADESELAEELRIEGRELEACA